MYLSYVFGLLNFRLVYYYYIFVLGRKFNLFNIYKIFGKIQLLIDIINYYNFLK